MLQMFTGVVDEKSNDTQLIQKIVETKRFLLDNILRIQCLHFYSCL